MLSWSVFALGLAECVLVARLRAVVHAHVVDALDRGYWRHRLDLLRRLLLRIGAAAIDTDLVHVTA